MVIHNGLAAIGRASGNRRHRARSSWIERRLITQCLRTRSWITPAKVGDWTPRAAAASFSLASTCRCRKHHARFERCHTDRRQSSSEVALHPQHHFQQRRLTASA